MYNRIRCKLSRVAAFLIILASTWFLLELVLRVIPPSVARNVQNLAFAKYGTFPGDIYFLEPVSHMYFMFTNYHARMFYNGYRWNHETDQYGFRNPRTWKDKRILLLGDSLIYGHGVEENQTAAYELRKRGYPVYNLSAQGECLYDHYVMLRLHLSEFKPRIVVLFVFLNDFHDLEMGRSAGQIEDPPELRRYNYGDVRQNLVRFDQHRGSSFSQAAFRLASVRLFACLYAMLHSWTGSMSLVSSAEAVTPSAEPLVNPDRFKRIARYYQLILRDLGRRCRMANAKLMIIQLNTGHNRKTQTKLREFLQNVAATENVPFYTTRGIFRDCPECFLPNDGHFSETGHLRLADFLARVFDRSPNTRKTIRK